MTKATKAEIGEIAAGVKSAASSSNKSNTLDLVKSVTKDTKVDEGKINLPKYRNFKGRDFSKMDMTEMFESKVCKHGDFTGANLAGANFRDFNLQGCIFKGANLDGAVFIGADLRWADFNGVDNPEKAIFSEIDEDGLPVNKADLREVDGLTR